MTQNMLYVMYDLYPLFVQNHGSGKGGEESTDDSDATKSCTGQVGWEDDEFRNIHVYYPHIFLYSTCDTVHE